ncbi:MAG TPA: asparagine synthase (glutamine-hydrolyzing) [Pyrinomonadaceae bacterium]|nr:asparagine synthase (glutamine-hydrolyzing) [Pyrinomonadaceae bacterium]
MCGIAGMIGADANSRLVAQMADAQRHRGPDGDGFYFAPGVELGHRRLKIIDLTEAGRQPMSTPDGRYTIVYNGEVYNYRELRSELSDHAFRSNTDTEVVLQAFARWGPKCLDRFVGMFAFAIWDADERELFCARDRLGIKPFYYARLGQSFLFSSEIRPLLRAGLPRSVNEQVLFDFLSRDFYEHSDETFFKGIHKLAPASWMIVGADAEIRKTGQYWDLATEVERADVPNQAEDREERLLSLCSDAVDLHLRSDVPVAVALSGGLDSATLLSLLDRVHPDPTRVEAFSFSFAEQGYSERPFVEAMARHTGRRAGFVKVAAQQFANTAERVSVGQEEPYAGTPIWAYTLCFELLRQRGFIVVMDGSGLDEGLAGYARFRPGLWADLFEAGNWDSLEREFAASGVSTGAQRKQALIQMQAATAPEGDVGIGQDLTRSVRADCVNPDLAAKAGTETPCFQRPFADNLRNLMYRELRYTKLPRALRFRDRLSMAVSTELRPPFLDHRLLGYEFALPQQDRIHKGVSKAILRRAALRLLPDSVRMASKRSVQTPQREWFRNELKSWVRERIDRPAFWQRGWVDRRKGMQALEAFLRGEGDNSFFLWQWINLEMWAEHFLDGSYALAART